MQNIWRTSAIKRQECSKLGTGPNCPLQTQTVTHTHTHCLTPKLCQGFIWVFDISASCPGAFGVCRWDPSQAHFWGTLGCEAMQEPEFGAPVICCLFRLAGIPPRLGSFRDCTPLQAAVLEIEGDSHLTRSSRFPLTCQFSHKVG